MRIRPSLTILALPAMAAALAACGSSASRSPAADAGAAPTPRRASLVIHHQTLGCHAWSVNGGVPMVVQNVSLTPGSTLTIADNDVMAHTVVQTGGPRIVIDEPLTDKTRIATITFTRPGTYRFATGTGEDYTSGIVTRGEDHSLRLTVVVA